MSDRPKWLTAALEFLLDNFTVLATIAYASYIIYRQEFGEADISTNQLITGILAVLGLLATSELIERYRRLSKIEKSTDKLVSMVQKEIVDRPSAIRFFENTPILDAFFKSAHTIELMGVTLTSTLDKQASNIREAINNGAKVRVILANPSPKSLAIKMATLRSEEPHVETYFKKKLDSSFEVLEYMKRMQNDQTGKSGSFEVHLVNYAPSFGIASFDFGQPNGIVFVEIYSHVSGYDTQIAFNLTKKRDGNWFDYFQNQFEDIWRNSVEWKPEKKN